MTWSVRPFWEHSRSCRPSPSTRSGSRRGRTWLQGRRRWRWTCCSSRRRPSCSSSRRPRTNWRPEGWQGCSEKSGFIIRCFLTTFIPWIALTSVFATQIVILGFLRWSLSFISPVTKHLFQGLLQAIGSERVHAEGVPERIGALKFLDYVQVWSPAVCMTGKCYAPPANVIMMTSFFHKKQPWRKQVLIIPKPSLD